LSPPRSGRGASRPAARSSGRPAGARGVFVQTPKSDIYVTMLGIALGAIVLGCLLLVLLLNRYEWQIKAAAIGGNTPHLASISSDRAEARTGLAAPV
jgi:hypothetical protein